MSVTLADGICTSVLGATDSVEPGPGAG